MFSADIQGIGTAIVYIIAGLGLLLYSGDLLVRGAVALAQRFRIPPIIIGLTIVAFGTSAPELFIGIQSVWSGNTGIALGNVVGSNIANILLVLGLPSIIYPTLCDQHSLRRNTFIMIGATLVFMALIAKGHLVFHDGLILFGLIVLFLIYSARRARRRPGMDPALDELAELDAGHKLPRSTAAIFSFQLLGIIGLPVGAHLMVDGGVFVAEGFGVSETVIGLSVIAIGTSLPELAFTTASALRRQSDVAIGNIIGSNIFNLLAVMGLTTMAAGKAGIPVSPHLLHFDIWVMLAASLVLVPLTLFHRPINRPLGIAFLLFYLAYIFALYGREIGG